MTFFVKSGTSYRPTAEQNVDIHPLLPAGNYIIKADQFGNMFFDTVDSFDVSFKRYGENPSQCARILQTFYSRPAGTGVMLTGEKGSGKSLLARTVSAEAAKRGTPTIIINAAWFGDAFNTLIQSVRQPAIILFDEFEKVYSEQEQEQILTLLDGVFPSQKLFIFTCNDKWRVDRHMRNRPGRIFYFLEFGGLDPQFVEAYCRDHGVPERHIQSVCQVSSLFKHFNFDMLKALIEEMRRYDESPAAALKWLNARPEFEEAQLGFRVTATKDGNAVEVYSSTWSGNPILETFHLVYKGGTPSAKKDRRRLRGRRANPNALDLIVDEGETGEPMEGKEHVRIILTPADLRDIDPKAGTFVYEKDGVICTLTRKQDTTGQEWLSWF